MSESLPNNKPSLFKSILFLGLFLGLFFWLLGRQGYGLIDLLQLNPRGIFAWFFIICLTWWINGQKIRVLLGHWQIKFPKKEAFLLASSSSLLNYLPLQGGAAARGLYLKSRLNLPLRKYLSLLSAYYVFHLMIQSLLGLVLCLSELPSPKVAFLAGLFALGLGLSLFLAFFRLPRGIKNWLEKGRFSPLLEAHQNFLQILRDRKCLWRLIQLDLLLVALEGAKIYLAFYFLGFGNFLTWKTTIIITNLALPTVLLNFTPAGLGVRESAIALAAASFSFPVEKALLAASLDRMFTLLVVFSLGAMATWYVMKNFLSQPPQEKPS